MTDLSELLRHPYTRALWHRLLPRLLPGRIDLFASPLEFPLTADSQRAFATGFRQIGRSAIPDGQGGEKILAVFEVDVAPKVDLLRNRVALRQLVARCIDEFSAHGVLAFFVQPGNQAYRLTYATRESAVNTETLAVETRETETRRYTYVLGPGESRRTAALRLAGLAAKRDRATLIEITEAFSVELLNQEFFATYKAQYERFCNHLVGGDTPVRVFGIKLKGLDEKAIDHALKPIRDFVKKLLGRLVFLHFLQKKGWLGCPPHATDWQNGEADFLQRLFRECPTGQQDQFHSRRLVPLFFETLNRERKGDIFKVTGTRVPYLNGGLFERDFDGVESLDFPADLFRDLLEFFAHYNFTIDENDPDDREIGIDPEMLGHIFENLLEDNKDKGAYYTPKAVVQYMARKTLLHALTSTFPGDPAAPPAIERLIRTKEPPDPRQDTWLATHATAIEERLDALRICDPAIGSGAFPIGLLSEIYWTKLALHPALNRAAAKLVIIQRSIHGVDLDAGAVEIARLRFWLALVVEEPAPVPLPNLDYQIMQGNSLLESFEGEPLDDLDEPVRYGIRRLGSDQDEIDLGAAAPTELIEITTPTQQVLADLRRTYFACHAPTEKARLRREIDAAVLRAIDARLERRRDELEISLQSEAALAHGRTRTAPETKKRAAMTAELATLAEKSGRLHKLLADPRAERPFFLWHLWFRHVIAAPPDGNGGFDIVIANPPYVSAIEYKKAFGESARVALKEKYVTAKGAWDLYVLFYELALDLLSKGGITCFINPNKFLAAPYAESLRNHLLSTANILELVDVSRIRAFQQVDVYPIIAFFELGAERQRPIRVWLPHVEEEQDFDITNFSDHIVPVRYLKLLPESLWSFLLSKDFAMLEGVVNRTRPLIEYGEVNASSTAAEADEYGRFFTENGSTRWKLINTGLIERYESLWGCQPLTHQRKQYLNPRLPTSSNVSATRRNLYDSPKVIFAKMALVCEAYPDIAGEYASVNTNCFYAPKDGRSIQFFTAIFNSKAFMHIYGLYFGALRMAGGYFPWGSPQLRLMPMPTGTKADQDALNMLVDGILAAKRASDVAAGGRLESEIDAHVYRLYQLTPEEIELIKKAAPDKPTCSST